MVHPVCVEADVGNADKATQSLVKDATLDDGADGCVLPVYTHVGVESRLPHGNKEDHVALLAGVFLGDLKFDGLGGVRECGEEGGDGLACLKVDGAVLDLNDYVGFELAVERAEVVVTGA